MWTNLLLISYRGPCFIFLATIIFAAITGCGNLSRESTANTTPEATSSSDIEGEDELEKPLIQFTTINLGAFNKELVSNGPLSAGTKATIEFSLDGIIERILVKEGDRVSRGQELAAIERTDYQRSLEQKNLQLTKARLDFEDLLLRMGYKLKDTASIAPDILQMARIRSGLAQALSELEQAQDELAKTTVRAPFSGVIAGVLARAHNATSVSSRQLCTLIDDRRLVVEFPVLETELGFVRRSHRIEVRLFNNDQIAYSGTLVSINPQVDAGGMVMVRASVANTDNNLLDGMNVKVAVRQTVPGQLVVPKEAVLERQGRKVVFTYEDSLAKWNYVETGLENSSEYTITSGLKPGDKVIYEGNFNLAHEKPVRVKDEE